MTAIFEQLKNMGQLLEHNTRFEILNDDVLNLFAAEVVVDFDNLMLHITYVDNTKLTVLSHLLYNKCSSSTLKLGIKTKENDTTSLIYLDINGIKAMSSLKLCADNSVKGVQYSKVTFGLEDNILITH